MSPDRNDLRDEEYGEENPAFSSDDIFEDEFDQLRHHSARSGSTFDEMETEPEPEEDPFAENGRSRFSLGNFTSTQRLILALLVVLDILAIGFGVLVVLGRVTL